MTKRTVPFDKIGTVSATETPLSNASTEPVPSLQLLELSKHFGNKRAVDHINLCVPAGSFFGLVGPNGAGKTTALSMAVGLLRPDAGVARIFGIDMWKDPVQAKKLIGVLPDGGAMPERLTGRELLTYLGELRGLDASVVAQRADELLTVLELQEAERTLIIDYSTGMRKKIGLAVAMLHAPKLLILDEPLEAVDPISAATIKVLLQRYVMAGGSVIFSSHVMPVVEQVCNYVAILAGGRVLAAGKLEEVRNGKTLEQRFIELVDVRAEEAKELSWLTV